MLDFTEAIILSIVQGLTELLPISSSGHLILATNILDIKPTVELLAFLHIASVLAIAVSYREKIVQIILGKHLLSTVGKIIVAIIPVAVIGLIFEDSIDKKLYVPSFIAANLIFWGVAMILIEIVEKKGLIKSEEREPSEITWGQSLLIGFAQVLAILPGTSRSGITTMAGMLMGIKKRSALDFSFIIGIPSLGGAYLLASLNNKSIAPVELNVVNLLMLVSTFIVSYAAIVLLKRFSDRRFLTFFGVYRIALGVFILMLLQ